MTKETVHPYMSWIYFDRHSLFNWEQ